jgi:predicted amidohydrolase YtcJ
MGRSTRRRFLAQSGALAAAGLISPAAIGRALARGSAATTVFRGGPVLTWDDARATAVAVRDGVIVYVGDDAGVDGLVSSTTEVIDLAGRLLMPGIHDAHNHALSAGRGLAQCSLDYEPLTIPQMRDRIQRCLDQTRSEEPDGWLRVRYWDYQAIQPPGTVPTRQDLDELDTTRPIIVHSLDGHSALANSRALELANITASTPDPPDGHIVRDADGEPTGLLQDDAIGLVTSVIPPPSVTQDARSLRAAIKRMNRAGITSYMDASADESELAAGANLRDAGRHTIRAQMAVYVSSDDLADPATLIPHLQQLRAQYAGGMLQIPTIKLFFDGVIEYPTQTAALLKPYRVNTGTDAHPHWEPGDSRGPTYIEPELAASGITALDAAGWQVHMHAIGDRAVRTALDGVEAALEANGQRDNRHTLSHIELVHPDDLARFGEVGALACMQMQWAELDSYTVDYVKPYLGSKRWRYLYPSGSIAAAGGTLTGGSDWPVDPLLPFRQIEMGMNRTGDDIYPAYPGPLHAEEKLRRRQSIRMHTQASAYQLHQETETGSIAEGMLADLIVVDRDIQQVPLKDISTTEVLMTMVGGDVVHRAKDL